MTNREPVAVDQMRSNKKLSYAEQMAVRVALADLRVKLGSDRAIAEAFRVNERRVRRAVLYSHVTPAILTATLRYLGIDRDALMTRYDNEEVRNRLANANALDSFAWPDEPTPKQVAIVAGVQYGAGVDEALVIQLADELEPQLSNASTGEWIGAVLKVVQKRYVRPRLQAKAEARAAKTQARLIRREQSAIRELHSRRAERIKRPVVHAASAPELVVDADALRSEAARGYFKVALRRETQQVLRCGKHGIPVRDVHIEFLDEQTIVTLRPCCVEIAEYLGRAVDVALKGAQGCRLPSS